VPAGGIAPAPVSGRWWALGAIVICALIIGLDATVLNVALPTLSAKLHASESQLQWITNAYTLVLGCLVLPAGVLGDRFGRRTTLVVGLLIFGVSTVVASQMTSANGLIGARVAMGVGSAIITPLSFSILPSLFGADERPKAIAVMTASTALGLPLGPLIGGWLLKSFDWGTIFLINAPVVVIALVAVLILIPNSRDPKAPPLDWLGSPLVVLGAGSLVYAIIDEPIDGWTDARVIAGFAVGAVLLVAFVVWELRTRFPMVDLRLFLRPRFGWGVLVFALVGFALQGMMFVLTPYLQDVEGNDAFGTGVRLLPLLLTLTVGALLGTRLTPRVGTKLPAALGMVIIAAGLGLFTRVGAGTGYGLVAASLAVMGVGLGCAMTSVMDAVMGELPPASAGGGSGISLSLRMIAGTFGVAVLGSILNSVYRHDLDPHLGLAGLPAALRGPVRQAVESSVAGAQRVAEQLPAPLAPIGRSLFDAARHAYLNGMVDVLYVCAGMALFGALMVAILLPARARAGRPEAPAPAETAAAPQPRPQSRVVAISGGDLDASRAIATEVATRLGVSLVDLSTAAGPLAAALTALPAAGARAREILAWLVAESWAPGPGSESRLIELARSALVELVAASGAVLLDPARQLRIEPRKGLLQVRLQHGAADGPLDAAPLVLDLEQLPPATCVAVIVAGAGAAIPAPAVAAGGLDRAPELMDRLEHAVRAEITRRNNLESGEPGGVAAGATGSGTRTSQ
jgi:EmrB/QacA subfamily drug resistance transporter